jgi:glycosyltransferase involved in cell wall biosynthesis
MLSTTGGSSIMAGEIAWRLRQVGHTVLTCHCASDAAPSENTTALSKDYAFHVQRNLDIDRSFVGGIDTCSQVLGWHKATAFDVLHVHSVPVFGLAALHLKRLRGVPYIVTFHGTDVLDANIAEHNREMLGAILGEASAVTCVSEHLGAELSRFPELPRAQVIHNFLRHEFAAAPHGTPREGPSRYLHVSSLRPVKRPELLIEAFHLVSERESSARLRIITPREGLGRAQDLLSLGPRGAIDVEKGSDDARALVEAYADATALVLTSRFESFGLVILEALALGVPVVAPALGGIVEVIGDDWPLLVRDTADPRAYAQAMSAAARPEMRALARDRAASVLHRFSASKQVDRYLGLYDQALGRST